MNEVQSTRRATARWTQRTVDATPAVVLRRLAAATGAADPAVRLGPATKGTLVAASRRHRVQRGGVAVGWIELTPLTATTTLLEVAAEEPGAASLIGRITTAACGPDVPKHRAVVARRTWRHHARRATAGVAVLALVTGSAVAYRLLAPPEPLAVDQAVAQFQQTPTATDPGPLTVVPQATDPPSGDAASARRRIARARRQSTPAEPTRQPTAQTRKTATDEAPRPRGNGAAAEAQPVRRRDAVARPTPLPAAGVYTYTTSGHEEIDHPKDRHDYPRETALTVQHSGCGFTTRWQPLRQRWDEMEICSGKERTLARMTTQREFFGQRQRSDYRCDPQSRAWDTEPGAAWTTRCSDDESTVTTRLQVVGHEPIAVGGETVRAVHVQLRATVTGATRGKWTAERWLHPKTGLLLRLEGSTDATSSTPFGDVRYREQVRLDLQSLHPRR